MTKERKHSGGHLVWMTLVGTILYGTLSWITNFTPIGGAFDGQLRPGVAIPIVFGFIYGPWVGFLSGFLGNLGLDFYSGYLGYPPDPATGNLLRDIFAGYFLNWQIGNGLFGLIPGLWSRRYGSSYGRTRDLLVATVVAALAILIGTAFASFIDIFLFDYVDFNFALYQELIPIGRINLINGLLLVPILLFNYEHLDYQNLPSLRSGLTRRLLIAFLISAALPVVLLGLFLVQQNTSAPSESSGLMLKLAVTVGLTFLFTVANALLVSQTVTTPILRLADVARLVEEKKLTQQDIDEIKAMDGKDEITQLGHVFANMATEVIAREEKLQKQVRELRIEIDTTRQKQSVEEITDSEYFQDLQQKVTALRQRSRRTRSSSKSNQQE